MAHLHEVYDDDLYFSVDSEKKSISCQAETPPILICGNHNSERFTFEIPRYIEGHDMMQCDLAQVHYINIASGSTSRRSTGVYKITDLHIDPEDENALLCSWLISQNATLYTGSLSFALRFACTTGSKIEYGLNTSVYSGISVVETIDNANVVVEQYADILESWYMELMIAGTSSVGSILAAKEESIVAISEAKEEVIEDIKKIDVVAEVEQETLERIETAGDEIIEDMRKLIYTGETSSIDSLPIYEGDTEVIT